MFIVRKLVLQVNNSFIFCAKSRVDPLPKSLSSADKSVGTAELTGSFLMVLILNTQMWESKQRKQMASRWGGELRAFKSYPWTRTRDIQTTPLSKQFKKRCNSLRRTAEAAYWSGSEPFPLIIPGGFQNNGSMTFSMACINPTKTEYMSRTSANNKPSVLLLLDEGDKAFIWKSASGFLLSKRQCFNGKNMSKHLIMIYAPPSHALAADKNRCWKKVSCWAWLAVMALGSGAPPPPFTDQPLSRCCSSYRCVN